MLHLGNQFWECPRSRAGRPKYRITMAPARLPERGPVPVAIHVNETILDFLTYPVPQPILY